VGLEGRGTILSSGRIMMTSGIFTALGVVLSFLHVDQV
jgi:hypothetical protein